MLKEKQENGRSMIEMLGVLAIIGVLSVGGIAGYTSAMRSYKANEIINATSMLFMLGLASNAGEGNQPMSLDANMRPSGCGGITYKGDKAKLDVNIEDETICKQVKTKLGNKAGDCTAATSPATGYNLTVTLGDVKEEEVTIQAITDSECIEQGGYAFMDDNEDYHGCYPTEEAINTAATTTCQGGDYWAGCGGTHYCYCINM